MGSQFRTINVRMPRQMADKFSRLVEEIPGLPQSVLLRIILDAYFEQDLDDQVAGVLARLTKQGKAKRPSSQSQRPDTRESTNRLAFTRTNTKK